MNNRMKIRGQWRAHAVCADGTEWVEEWDNLVVNQGLNYLLNTGLGGGTQSTTWFIGLTHEGATPAAGDTMGAHAGWTENVSYSQASRLTYTPGTASMLSMSNAASIATFFISANTSFRGAFLTTSPTKSGTTGTLYAVGNFSQLRSLASNDSLGITAKFTMADDGV